ncbi:MAG: amidase [Planctomycetia bacterium]|nr:amidase [Planctomycetia bacterium]
MPLPLELAFASIRTLGQGLRAKQFSAVELAAFFLDRLEKFGPRFNAVVTVTRERALVEAAQADRDLAGGNDRGPLHGIPYGAKDLLATRGIPTTWGAAPYRTRVIDDDATVIRRLREAGAVLAGELSMVEIAGGMGYKQANASFNGPGLNPWNEKSWSGGSSSGSGSAVSAGLVPFAIGSETSGSIMTPAGYCGVTGLRPTYGRVSRQGAMALCWTMDKLGPICRTADDCGLVANAIAGHDPLDETSVSRQYRYPPEPLPARPFKLALLREPARKLQPDVQANFEAALKVLEGFASFGEVGLPDFPYSAVVGTIIGSEMSAAFEGMLTSGQVWELAAPEDRVGAHAAMLIPAKDYINACRIRKLIQKALDDKFAGFDAVVVPTVATVAPPIDREFRAYQGDFRGTGLTVAANAAGIPAMTVPNGFGERGLPTGLSFVGRAFDENRLITVAAAYQEATNWHQRHPDL